MSRRHRRMVLVPTLVAVSLLVLVAYVRAGTQTYHPPCSGTDATRMIAYENRIGDTSDGNDALISCINIADFASIDHVLPGDCHSTFPNEPNWGVCISSIQAGIPFGVSFCVYGGRSYTGWYERFTSGENGVRNNLAHNDQAMSARWVTSTSPC